MVRQALVVRDLGTLKGEVLIFGGPYSNLQATRAFIAQAVERGVDPSNCICTGDVVAYCADAAATVAEIRAFGGPVVAGNCERQLAARAGDCGCGFEAGSSCDVLASGWYAHADRNIGDDDRNWMRQLPDIVSFRHGRRRYAVIHGGATDVARFLWPTSDSGEFLEEVDVIEAIVGGVDRVIAGHAGLAFWRDLGRVQWINAGAIGMPPHDGRPETRFAALSGGGAVFHRLSYDHEAAARAMTQASLTQGYERGLSTGRWPSEDVLPDALRRG